MVDVMKTLKGKNLIFKIDRTW